MLRTLCWVALYWKRYAECLYAELCDAIFCHFKSLTFS